MRNPFKKYGHRKTRYDQMKEFDRQVKAELLNQEFRKFAKRSTKLFITSNPEFKKFIDTNLGIPWEGTIQEWTEKYRIKTGNLQEAIKRILISTKQAAENMQKAVEAMNKLSHPS